MNRRNFIKRGALFVPAIFVPRLIRAQNLLSLAGSPSGSTLNNGLVSHWKLGEASGTRNDSSGTNHLTDNNTVASATGKIGNAAQIVSAGAEWLSVADNATFGFTNAFSLSTWIYRDSITANQTIAGKWTFQTDGGWALQTGDTSAPDLTVIIATSATDDGTGCFMRFNDADQSVSTWYHLVMIYNGGLSGDANRLKLYQNNVALTLSVVAGAVPASLVADTADFNLGKFGGSLTRYFNGRIDETTLWNRAVTSTEVAELYNSGTGKTCCPFV